MTYKINDEKYRKSLDEYLDLNPNSVFIGRTGSQLYLASVLPKKEFEKVGGNLKNIEVAGKEDVKPNTTIPIIFYNDESGFIDSNKQVISISGKKYPVASPEDILGLMWSKKGLKSTERFEISTLMTVLVNTGKDINFELIRSYLKRCDDPEKEMQLKELAYTLS